MQKVKDLYTLSVEIIGVAMIISGLSNQLDNTETDTLTASAMRGALGGISSYLERIADDLDSIDDMRVEKRGRNDKN